MKPKYSLIIRWSDEDQCYIAWVPEFGTGVKTHGATYLAAAKAGQEVIEMLVEHESSASAGPLPDPWVYPDDVESDQRTGKMLFPGNKAYHPAKRRTLVKARHAIS